MTSSVVAESCCYEEDVFPKIKQCWGNEEGAVVKKRGERDL